MGMREAFEHWYSSGGQDPKAVERSGESYKLMQAASSWRAWVAAWESCIDCGADLAG